MKKVQRQERIVEEVKLVLKPAYNNRKISKEAYKEILRKTVPKVCNAYNVSPIYFVLNSGMSQSIWRNKSYQNRKACAWIHQEVPTFEKKR